MVCRMDGDGIGEVLVVSTPQKPHTVSDSCIHWHSFIVYLSGGKMIKNAQFDQSPQTNPSAIFILIFRPLTSFEPKL